MIKSEVSEDLVKQIQAENSWRGEIPGSLDELNRKAAAVTNKPNHPANPDFLNQKVICGIIVYLYFIML